MDQFPLNPDELLMLALTDGGIIRDGFFFFSELPMNSSVLVRCRYNFQIPPKGETTSGSPDLATSLA